MIRPLAEVFRYHLNRLWQNLDSEFPEEDLYSSANGVHIGSRPGKL